MTEIIGVCGKQGTGKTWLMTYIAKIKNDDGRPVFSNYVLKFPFTPVASLDDLQKVKHGVLLLDEVWLWMSARTSMNKMNQELHKVIILNRKRDVDIIYSAQHPKFVDVNLRRVTTTWLMPNIINGVWTDEFGNEINNPMVVYDEFDEFENFVKQWIATERIETIGNLYNTTEEIKELNKNNLTPLQKGIKVEQDFAKAVSKCKGVNYVELLPNSGNNGNWGCDVIVYAKTGVYGFDIKGDSKTHVYLDDYGEKLLKKIKNIKEHHAIPYLAFPNKKFIRLGIPNAWYVYELIENTYLKRLNSRPFYKKLVNKSKILSNINFYKK